jgi:hypothetical protein
MHPWIAVEPDAERLLAAVEQLPEAATAVAHFCEHNPGVPGVVIAMEPDRELRATFGRLPERRHDPVLDRWWIPAREGPLEALAEELRPGAEPGRRRRVPASRSAAPTAARQPSRRGPSPLEARATVAAVGAGCFILVLADYLAAFGACRARQSASCVGLEPCLSSVDLAA